MKVERYGFALVLLFAGVFLKPLHAEETKSFSMKVDLSNHLLFRNDSDFDRSAPYYNPDGQSVGIAGTLLKPQLTWNVNENLKIYYEFELGLNIWSKNNPDLIDPVSENTFLLKHREVWAEGWLPGRYPFTFGFKAGYRRFISPTGLFINHWIGAASIMSGDRDNVEVSLSAGLIPDQTYEGIVYGENNFSHDTVLLSATAFAKLYKEFDLTIGFLYLIDNRIVDKQNTIFCLETHLDLRYDKFDFYLDAAVQYGNYDNAAADGSWMSHLAFGLQGGGNLTAGDLKLKANLLLLSPDDDQQYNKKNGGFYYSGKSRSSTLFLSEDENRDWYDNIDEKIAYTEGAFFVTRAGLFVADVKAEYDFGIFEPALIVGAAFVLNKKNALNNSFAGFETDADLKFVAGDYLEFHLIGGLLIPGGAASAHMNGIDRYAKDAVYSIESHLVVRY
ncbi:MAG: hypothetical protein FJ088_03285 [Deltaproteobacteria bacterium]|nr:hypothetical protein [Deltaproteobacteria bacterium]